MSRGAKSPLQSLPLVSAAFRCGVEASPVEREDDELTHSFTHTHTHTKYQQLKRLNHNQEGLTIQNSSFGIFTTTKYYWHTKI